MELVWSPVAVDDLNDAADRLLGKPMASASAVMPGCVT